MPAESAAQIYNGSEPQEYQSPRLQTANLNHRAAAYDYRLDIQANRELDLIENSPLAMERRAANKRFVRRQIETLLGEKFNVLLSTSRYNIIDGRLYGEDMFVPASDSFKNGINHRRAHGNPVDFPREDAELVGFETIEERMVDANVGHMEFFPSLPGGTYKHRFHDIFIKKADEDGNEYVEARRYSSGLNVQEYRKFIRSLGVDIPKDANDVYFLANPVSISDSRFKTPEDIHKFLHREHSYMTREEFEKRILEPTSPYIDVYQQNPKLLTFKAVLNRSDEVNEERKKGIVSIANRYSMVSLGEIDRLGNQEIKQEDLPCGNLSTEEKDENSTFSVSEFDIDYEFDDFGSCRECGGETSLGPCGICRPCDLKMRQKQKLGNAASL